MSSSKCKSTGWPTDWLVNSGLFTAFSYELSQIVLRHYNRNIMNIVVCTIINNWMANNTWELYIWYNYFEIVPWNNEISKTRLQLQSELVCGGRDTSRVAIKVDEIAVPQIASPSVNVGCCTGRWAILNDSAVHTLIFMWLHFVPSALVHKTLVASKPG